jgi:hypothetical protein
MNHPSVFNSGIVMKNPLFITTTFLGIYAGLIAIQHGIFEILQGSRAPDDLMFNAIGLPCQPETIWHACFPAMTLIPSLLITGIAAVLVGMGMVIWSALFAGHKQGGLTLGLLSLLALLVGGGFVPVFIGMVAAIASRGLSRPLGPSRLVFLSAVWPLPLVLMALWLPGSWLLGHFFSAAMLSAGGVLFFIFDLCLPVLAAILSQAHTEQKKIRSSAK